MTEHEQRTLIEGLIRLLAGTVVLRCKARFFAWSIGHRGWDATRDLFQKDYRTLDNRCDDLARTISMLGGQIPGCYSHLAKISSIKEQDSMAEADMIQQLAEDHDRMVFDTQFLLTIIEQLPDPDTMALLIDSMEQHEACARNLRSLLDKPTERPH